LAILTCGIDLGGTKIEAALIDLERMQVEFKHRVPTGAMNGYDFVLNQIAIAIAELETQSGLQITAIGLATPGTTDPRTGRLMNCNATCLNGQLLQKDLSERLKKTVIIANDANCFALAEACYGAGTVLNPPPKMVFGIILGTGVGGGLVFKNEIWPGMHGIAGEWGHQVLDSEGSVCYCGRSGCNETFFSGPALERYYTSLTGIATDMRSIAVAAKAKTDPYAVQTITFMMEKLGKALAGVINVLDPDLIVFGGGLSHIDALYSDLPDFVHPWVFHSYWKGHLLPPKLGDAAGIFGAAQLVRNSKND
jgi:fructokinase